MSPPASLTVSRARLADVADLRQKYREEMSAQIVHDSWHERGFTDLFLCCVDGQVIGYGAVGGAPGDPRDTVKEIYLSPGSRGAALEVLDRIVAVSGARSIEAQTNDRLLTMLLFERATAWSLTRVLFHDAVTTHLVRPEGIALRAVTTEDRARVFAHTSEPVGEWGLECDGVLVATGGIMSHYNPPYGDLYMEVAPNARRRGYGSYLVQELKRICRERGGIPAARCRPDNLASRRTLAKAGLLPCAHILRGTLRACSQ